MSLVADQPNNADLKAPLPDRDLAAIEARAQEIKSRAAELSQEMVQLHAKIQAMLAAQRGKRGRE